ncbi:MAG: hypothetical protein VB064_02405 [Oscillospiraceae bacterium]|nr:hypothetical protein [Oscillospiraceae bacterium]
MIRQIWTAELSAMLLIMCLVTALMGIPAGAVEENEMVKEIDVEPPAGVALQTQGRADIERYFVETGGMAADDGNEPDQASISPGGGVRELPITYDERLNDAHVTAKTDEGDEPNNEAFLYIIPGTAVLAMTGIFYIQKKKSRKGE